MEISIIDETVKSCPVFNFWGCFFCSVSDLVSRYKVVHRVSWMEREATVSPASRIHVNNFVATQNLRLLDSLGSFGLYPVESASISIAQESRDRIAFIDQTWCLQSKST